MNKLEKDLLWLGVEDYTGLWEAILEAGDATEIVSTEEAGLVARQAIDALLAQGLIKLFFCREPLDNDSVVPVPSEKIASVLGAAGSWMIPEEGGISVRFITTASGLALYKQETGWSED